MLNRYWDARDTPREEMYLEDVTTAARSARPAAEVYRDLRTAAASGWDFSSRWFDDDGDLARTRTTSFVPVDLNCFLFALEAQIARLSASCGDTRSAEEFTQRARARRDAIDRWLWDDARGAYADYDLLRGRSRAPCVATTLRESSEQWDRPNGWAPLQWLAIQGLARYGHHALAREIRRRWLAPVGSVCARESKLVEKYMIVEPTTHGARGGDGGEYPLQDGFGWTNGVTRKLLHQDPADPSHRARAGTRPR